MCGPLVQYRVVKVFYSADPGHTDWAKAKKTDSDRRGSRRYFGRAMPTREANVPGTVSAEEHTMPSRFIIAAVRLSAQVQIGVMFTLILQKFVHSLKYIAAHFHQ
jgi:hypothetical protein